MATLLSPPPMTEAEFLALPDDGVERWLIRGVLHESGAGDADMSYRNKFHSICTANITRLLGNWIDETGWPGTVVNGDAGFRLRQDPYTIVGIDVALVTAELLARKESNTTLFDGPPRLAVEVLSPNDTQEGIHEKRREYLAAGVPVVWLVDPDDLTVSVYERGRQPVTFNMDQELPDGEHVPGLKVAVAKVFSGVP